MISALGEDTQAILLLTAPLIVDRAKSATKPLTVGEYSKLARRLKDMERKPADLLRSDARELLANCSVGLDIDRLAALLGRGFLLAQAVERWAARAVWVMSRADADYPGRLKKHLQHNAPPVIYGCGDRRILGAGGLAVVGSRNANDFLIEYTERIGGLAATAGRSVVSGGAAGIDQAAMRGALNAGGGAVGVLANGLAKAAVRREYREPLMDQRLVLLSTYDPAASFHVGNAMRRNKLIYALADAALVVESDHEKGGTWTGAVEQLDKCRFVPVYVRMDGDVGKGLCELKNRGARPWPSPNTPEDLERILLDCPPAEIVEESSQPFLPGMEDQSTTPVRAPAEVARLTAAPGEPAQADSTPAEELFAKVKELVLQYTEEPRTHVEVAEEFEIGKGQARDWLKRLVAEGALERLSKPVRYQVADNASDQIRGK